MIKLSYTGPVCGVNEKYILARNSRRMILNSKYRDFRDAMAWTFAVQGGRPMFRNRVLVILRMWLSPGMDSDAILKPIFDAMQEGQVLSNDNKIRKYAVEKDDITDGEPHFEIEVSEL